MKFVFSLRQLRWKISYDVDVTNLLTRLRICTIKIRRLAVGVQ